MTARGIAPLPIYCQARKDCRNVASYVVRGLRGHIPTCLGHVGVTKTKLGWPGRKVEVTYLDGPAGRQMTIEDYMEGE